MSDRACPVCASPVPAGNAFCGACGARLPATGTEPRADALIGRVVDSRFRILRLIGTGGMGAVYLAEHVGIGKRVAIKVLRADLRNHPDLVGRFRREAMAVSKLTDPHTITVFDFGVWRGLVFLVMEYLRGADLAMVLEREGRLEPPAAFDVALQILSSLAEAHGKGIVHRDLKPENVYITRAAGGDELVKVLDFGLAKMLPGATHARNEQGFQTREGALLGTPYYMAPEQIRGDAVDGRCDLYAVGALLFRMVTGRHPYEDRNPMRVFEAHLAGEVPSFAAVAADVDVPDGTEALIRALLAVEPQDRPPEAMAVIERIHTITDRVRPRGRSAAPPPAESDAPSPAPVQPTRPDAVSAFSTSILLDDPRWTAAEVSEPEIDPATREDFLAYERGLRRRGVVRTLLLLLVATVALGGGGWLLFGQAPKALTGEVEPNNEPKQATLLTAGVALQGHLGARQHEDRSDRDVFRLAVPGGAGRLSVTLTGVPRIDLILEGFDKDGEKLFEVNAGGVGAGEALSAQAVAVDPVYLSVREVWVQGQPPSENSTDAYTLTATLEP